MKSLVMTDKDTDTPVEIDAGFVGDTHPAFFLQFRPRVIPRALVIYLPPFGEEMNRCRSLVAQQARWFARRGISCALLDFYGTGESQGNLSDATLAIWRQNIDDLVQLLLPSHSCPLYLWGCRLGALLVLDYVDRRPGAAAKVLLWQPVTSGSTFVNQLLRQRTAALIQKGERGETTADMKVRLAAGELIEVAGYQLGGGLITALDQLGIGSLQGAAHSTIFWLEQGDKDHTSLSPRVLRSVDQLKESGARVKLGTFSGDPVWQLHKRGHCDDLLDKTRALGL